MKRLNEIRKKINSALIRKKGIEVLTIPIDKRPDETKEQAVERYNKENNIIDDGSKVLIYIIE